MLAPGADAQPTFACSSSNPSNGKFGTRASVRNGSKADGTLAAGLGGKLPFRCYHLGVMQRAATLALWMPLGTLSGCWHHAFYTTVENGTKQTVYATIDFEDRSTAPGHGNIKPGKGVSLTQKIEAIRYIDYQTGQYRCRLDKGQIAKLARVGSGGVTTITLGECAPASSAFPAWVSALVKQQQPQSRTVIEESSYQGRRTFLVMPSDRAPDSGNEHVLHSEDGRIICEFGGFVGEVTVGSCDINGIKYVRTIFGKSGS